MAAQAGDQAPTIIDAAKHAFVDGWVQSMWLGVGMAAVALVYLIVRGPVRVDRRRAGRGRRRRPVDGDLDARSTPARRDPTGPRGPVLTPLV